MAKNINKKNIQKLKVFLSKKEKNDTRKDNILHQNNRGTTWSTEDNFLRKYMGLS
jgi:hypothetical protein